MRRAPAGAYASLIGMTDDTLRWRGGWARLGSWRGRADVAYLSVGADRPPTPEIVDRCLRLLRGRGYSAVVTSALAARRRAPVPRRRLLGARAAPPPRARDGRPPAAAPAHPPGPRRATAERCSSSTTARSTGSGASTATGSPTRSRPRRRAASGSSTGGDGLARVRGHRPRRPPRLPPAARGRTPTARREGYGRAVVLDGLRWLRRHGATQALVNTQRDNDAGARALRGVRLPRAAAGLCVMGRSL